MMMMMMMMMIIIIIIIIIMIIIIIIIIMVGAFKPVLRGSIALPAVILGEGRSLISKPGKTGNLSSGNYAKNGMGG